MVNIPCPCCGQITLQERKLNALVKAENYWIKYMNAEEDQNGWYHKNGEEAIRLYDWKIVERLFKVEKERRELEITMITQGKIKWKPMED